MASFCLCDFVNVQSKKRIIRARLLDAWMFLVVSYPSFQIGSHVNPIDQSKVELYRAYSAAANQGQE